jgi:hypothetical protein
MIKESKSEIERLKSQLKLLENHIQVAKEVRVPDIIDIQLLTAK